MANKKITELMAGTPTRDSLIESATDVGGNMVSRKFKVGAVADVNNVQIANEYDDTATYNYGAYCIKDGVLYRCITAISVAEAWDSTHWTTVMVTGEFRRVVELTSAQYSALSSAEKNNGTLYIITDEETTAADIPYSQGVSVADILDIQTNDTVLSASWIAQSQTAGDTPLTDYLSLTKGFYLVIVAYPILDTNDTLLSDIVGSNISKWGGSYIQLTSQQNSVRLVRVNANTQIRVNSMQSKNVNFTYLDRGGLFAYRLA